MHKRARKIMKRTKDHEHNLKQICTEIRYDFEKWQDIQEKWNDLKEKGKETEVTRE